MKRLLFLFVISFSFFSLGQSNNYSIDFTGFNNDYITIDPNFQFSNLSGTTFSVWIKKPILNSGCCANGYILDFSDGVCDNCWSHRYTIGQNNGSFAFSLEGSSGTNWYVGASANGFDNEWVHIVGTADLATGNAKIYINGLLAATSNIVGSDISLGFGNSISKVLGDRSITLDRGYDGLLDDVSIFNFSLNDQEVLDLYNSPCLNGNEPGLIGYWDFEEGFGNTANDLTIDSNNGTLLNGATYSTDVPLHICCTSTLPTVDLGGDQTLCTGNNVVLDAGAGYNYYSWSTGETSQTITVTEAGEYTATVGDSTPVANEHSLEFDGVDDYVGVSNVDINSNDFTWSTWVNVNPSTSDDYIIDNRVSTDVGGGFIFITSSFEAYYGYSEGGVPYWQANSGVILDPNTWYYITMVKSNDKLQIYLDGAFMDEIIVPSSINYNSTHFIGTRHNNNNGHFLDGRLDNFEIWNMALSSNQIQQFMNCPPTGNEPGLVGYWNFEEGTGTTVTDLTVNGNDGTINGATWSTDTPEQICLGCTASDSVAISILDPTITASAETICLGDSTKISISPTITFSDTIIVDSYTSGINGAWNQTMSTNIGSSYVLRISGSWTTGSYCPNPSRDAAYIIPGFYGATESSPIQNDILCNDAVYCSLFCDLGCGPILDRPDVDEYNSDNTYDYSFVAQDNSFNIGFVDFGGYGDNCGSVTFTLFEIQNTFGNSVWSTTETSSSIWVTPGATTTYSVTVDDGIGSCTDDIEITVNDPQIDLGAGGNICVGDSVLLDAGAGFDQYVWSTGDSTQTIYATSSGTYTATVGLETPVVNEYSMSFDGYTNDISITDNSTLNGIDGQLTILAWIKTDTLSSGASPRIVDRSEGNGGGVDRWLFTQANASENHVLQFAVGQGATENINGSTPMNQQEWSFASAVYNQGNVDIYLNGVIDGQGTISISSLSHVQNVPMSLGSTNGDNSFWNGNLDQISIWNTALTQAEIQQYMNCPPSGNEAGLLGYWSFEDGNVCSTTDLSPNGNDGNINGATYSTDTPEQVCVSCTATSDVVVTEVSSSSSTDPHQECDSFTWIDGNTYTESNNTATFVIPNAAGCDSTITLDLTILSPSSSTDTQEECEEFTWIDGNTYTESNNTATFVIPNAVGCDSTITLNLTINNLTTLDAGVDQTVCEGTDVTLTATGAAVYDWDDDIQNGVPFTAQLGSNTYTVEGTDANGCEDEQSVTIIGTPYPELTFEVTDPACQGESSGNVVAVATNGTAPYSFVWNNGTLQAENNNIGAGTYDVTVTDDNGCETPGSVVVTDPTESCFYIPGALSPNGDGANETWEIGGLSQFPEAIISVFDRWGQKVYSGDYTSPPWDGTYNGSDLPTADYYYILDLGNGEKYNGVVTLKR